MKPAPFHYLAAHSLEEALEQLHQYGNEARVLAGGQSLIPAMNFRLARPEVLVDLNRVGELSYCQPSETGLRIGAMARQSQVEHDPLVRERVPLLAEILPQVAHPQIRNRGTIGGSLAHADPAAELPAVALALGARLKLVSASGERWVAAEDFFLGLFETSLAPGELLAEVEFPSRSAGEGQAFAEVARRHGDYALLGVAVSLRLDGKRRCREVRLVFISAGDRPLRAAAAERMLLGETPGGALLEEVARLASERDLDPPADIHASSAYRRQLARVLLGRTLALAVERARP